MTAASRLKVVDCRCAAMVFIGRLRRLSPYGVSFRLAASSSVPLTIPPRHFVALSRPGGKRVTGFSVVCRLPMNPVPLPPDKQGGAREYIGARHPPLRQGVGKGVTGLAFVSPGEAPPEKIHSLSHQPSKILLFSLPIISRYADTKRSLLPMAFVYGRRPLLFRFPFYPKKPLVFCASTTRCRASI